MCLLAVLQRWCHFNIVCIGVCFAMAPPVVRFMATFGLHFYMSLVVRVQFLMRILMVIEETVHAMEALPEHVRDVLRELRCQLLVCRDSILEELDWLDRNEEGVPMEALEPRPPWADWTMVEEEQVLLKWHADWKPLCEAFHDAVDCAFQAAAPNRRLNVCIRVLRFTQAARKLALIQFLLGAMLHDEVEKIFTPAIDISIF